MATDRSLRNGMTVSDVVSRPPTCPAPAAELRGAIAVAGTVSYTAKTSKEDKSKKGRPSGSSTPEQEERTTEVGKPSLSQNGLSQEGLSQNGYGAYARYVTA
uniref:Uncharacterized protein n=1 Tax=Prorocentrum micans TaxID=2945 RepID=A0A7S2TD15_PROMC|mmetsp:Transcript_15445/g.12388  ORF Transcript_15445/g.12388 Transcript_15445/m.12388 type:complete len:102 (+) Transcript_15445:40-345(+)